MRGGLRDGRYKYDSIWRVGHWQSDIGVFEMARILCGDRR
jgi:hypothetical protein